MVAWPVLTILICIPLIGVLLIIANHQADTQATTNSTNIALFTATAAAALALLLFLVFDPLRPGPHYTESVRLVEGVIDYSLGMDGLARPFVLFVAMVMPCLMIVVLAGKRRRSQLAYLLLTEAALFGVFLALDPLLRLFFLGCALVSVTLMLNAGSGSREAARPPLFEAYHTVCWVLLLGSVLAGQTAALDPNFGTDAAEVLDQPQTAAIPIVSFVGFVGLIASGPLYAWVVAEDDGFNAPLSAIASAVFPITGVYGLFNVGVHHDVVGSFPVGPLSGALAGLCILLAAYHLAAGTSGRTAIIVLSLVQLAMVLVGLNMPLEAAAVMTSMCLGSALVLCALWVARDILAETSTGSLREDRPMEIAQALVTLGVILGVILLVGAVPGSIAFISLVDLIRLTANAAPTLSFAFVSGGILLLAAALRQGLFWRSDIEKLAVRAASTPSLAHTAALCLLMVLSLAIALFAAAMPKVL
ncbi:MAG: hypothetical protein AAGH60_08800 [Pseudomonadota bacterium]